MNSSSPITLPRHRIKVLLASLIILFSTFLVACSDDEAPSPESQAIGTWMLAEMNLVTPQDINQDGTPSSNLLREITCMEATLEVLDNNTWTLALKEFRVDGITIIDDCTDLLTTNGSWDITEAGNLLLTDSEYEIRSNQLILERSQTILGISSIVYEKQ